MDEARPRVVHASWTLALFSARMKATQQHCLILFPLLPDLPAPAALAG